MEEINKKELIENLINIYDRLVDDYNGSGCFEQMEEDRLTIYNVIEILESENKNESK